MVLYYDAGNIKYYEDEMQACTAYLNRSGGDVEHGSLGAGYSGTFSYLDYSAGNIVLTSGTVDCPY